jgi:phospholipid:diacylglycerol acyltransferase
VPAGSDPPGIKLRAAKALEAVDYFVPGYWVFSKLIQSLSDIGYDNNNLVTTLRVGGGTGVV